ncbi:tagatose 1,6-diphosphate aldolase [Candidatus Bipolaricaulota bacterium]|nr:tagatose 1,6-diphosphate aldolase [Candidatus Bipolaricaulota bacterium]
MKISEKKFNRMENLSDENGVIKAAAMDQRGSLVRRLSSACGIDHVEVTNEMMEEFKEAVSDVLTPHASAILLDPEWGMPGAKARQKGTGLVISYEKSSASRNYSEIYDHKLPAKINELIPDWTVRKSIEQGADAIKLLIYYHPDEERMYNAPKEAMVERVGAECARHEIPFFLEFVGYGLEGGDWKNDPELARQKPDVVTGSIEEFSRDRYNVDVLKVEFPVNMKFAGGTDAFGGKTAVYDRDQVLEHFQHAADAAGRPMIYLSAGVDAPQMRESLRLANEAGVNWNGVLCGRATWQNGLEEYGKDGVNGLREWLKEGGVENITRMNAIIDKGARPWYEAYGGKEKLEIV